jgi:glycosyltransferase involved in cell wall biosynthesis
MLAPDFYPFWGGVGVNVVDIVRRLPKEFEIHVVAVRRRNCSEQGLSEKLGFSDNVKVHFITSASETFLYNADFQLKCLKYVRRLIRMYNVNIIQSHMAHIPDVLLRFAVGTPIVTYIHSTIRWQFRGIISRLKFSELESSEAWTLILYPILETVHTGYFLRKRNSYYITESLFMKEFVQREYGVRIFKVIPNSIDVKEIRSNIQRMSVFTDKFEGKNVVLFAGRLVSYKGVDTFVGAIPRILSGVCNKHSLLFVFAGPGNIHGYYKKLRELNVPTENFTFTGPVPREQLLKLMALARCTVVPSYIDNIPNVVLESMACNTPVVASRVGGIPEAVIHNYNGFLVSPGNAEEIAKYVVTLLKDDNLSGEMGRRGFEMVKSKFCWDVNIPKYANLYKSIAA